MQQEPTSQSTLNIPYDYKEKPVVKNDKVFITRDILMEDIDSGKWVVVKRESQSTGLSVTEYEAQKELEKTKAQESLAAFISKADEDISKVKDV